MRDEAQVRLGGGGGQRQRYRQRQRRVLLPEITEGKG